MAEAATIDELRIDIESDAASASGGLDLLIQRLERLKTAVTGAIEGNGLNKMAKQMSKLKEAAQSISTLTGFENLDKLANSLNALNNVGNGKTMNINPMINSLRRLSEIVPTVNGLPNINVAKIGQLAEIATPFQSTNAKNLNSFISAIKKLPTIAADLANIDLDNFAADMQRLAAAMRPLAEEMNRIAAGFSAMPRRLQQYITQMERANAGTRSGGGLAGLSGTLATIKTKTLALYSSLSMLFNKLADCVNISNQFVENLNLFRVTMEDTADKAYDFAEAVNEAMGIDVSDWVRYQGFFQSIAKGFGIVSQKADLMSQNLTQLSYDISSFYNVSVEEAYNKVVSGLSGELEPLRRYGFALDEATLKQLALKKGITQSVESMTQAQKAQLRYVAVLEQANSIGILGDMSKTLDTSANQLRILSSRFAQFARAIGNLLMPMLSAVLPYFTAFIQVATDAAQHFANLFGFELPKIDIGTSNITTGYDDIAEAAGNATAATEKFKGSLAGVDQLNIIGNKGDVGSGTGSGLLYDLDIQLPTYDFLNGVESKTRSIYENMKNWFSDALPQIVEIAEAIGAAFVGIQAGKAVLWITKLVEKIKILIEALKLIVKTTKFGLIGGFAVGASSGVLLFDSIRDLISGTGELNRNLIELAAGIGLAAAGIAVFVALGNPVGAIVTATIAGVAALAGVIAGCNDVIEENNRIVTENTLFRNGGTKISEVADAYTAVTAAATDLNNQTIEKYKQLEQYDTKMESLLDTMEEIAGIEFNFDEITPADAEALKAPFEELIQYLKQDFKDSISLITSDLQHAFANLGIAESVSTQVQQAYSQMQLTFDETLTNSQKTVSQYLDILAQGGTLTEEQQKEFIHEYNLAVNLARSEDATYIDLQNAVKDLQQLDPSTIDFESDKTAISAIEQIGEAYSAYADSAKQLYDEEVAKLDQMRSKVQVLYNAGEIDDSQYDKYNALLDVSQYAFATNYNKSIEDMIAQISPYINTMYNQLGEAAFLQTPDLGDVFKAALLVDSNRFDELGLSDTADIAQEVAAGEWLDNNKVYQALQQFTGSMESTVLFDLEVTYDPDDPFADVYESLTTKAPVEVPVEFVPYTGKNEQYLAEFNGYYGVPSTITDAETNLPLHEDVKGAIDSYIAGASDNAPVDYSDAIRSFPSVQGSVAGMLAQNSAWDAGGTDSDINFTLHTTVEMDGDAVGEATAKYNLRNAFVSGGR